MMADTLESRFVAEITGTLTATLTDGTPTTVPFDKRISVSLTDGTTASKADAVWFSGSRTLTGSTSEDIDLYDFGSIDLGAGAGQDPLGQTKTLAEIVAILVVNDSTSTGNLTVGGKAATTAWNSPFNADDDAALGPFSPGGGCLLWNYADPAFAVADTSNHLLKIASSANLTYTIYVLGRTA